MARAANAAASAKQADANPVIQDFVRCCLESKHAQDLE
jgi:hypothetical protein